MNDRITRYIQKLKAEKKKQKQAAAFITAMSLVVSGTVSWQLHGIGTAMIDENLAEKTDENIHQLSDATLLCENSQIWENDLPDITGSNIRESVALIAGSQIGYEENTENFILDEDGESHKCYTRYGDWYGNPYGEWNTMFTYFCMKYGGVDEDDIPFGSGCWAWSVDLEKENLLIPMDRGSPQRGDVLLLDSDMDGSADRSGIVSEMVNEDDEKLIKVIEGNVGGKVAEQEYSIDDEHIIGFLALADNAETAVQTEETKAPSVMEFSGISESGIEVMASADVGTFPKCTVMTVSDIDHDEAVKAAKDSLDADTEMLDAVAVDISFSDKDGNEIEPCADTTVQVQIIIPDELKLHDGEFSLLHIADSGDVQKVENAEVSETGAEFVAEEFSIYVVTSNGNVDKDQYYYVNGSAVPNSSSNPYVVAVGEKFELYSESSFNLPEQGKQYFYNNSNNNKYFDRTYITDSKDIDRNGQTYRICEAEYTALKPGEATIAVVINNSYEHEFFYVKAVENKPVYIMNGNNRELLQNNTINVNVGDTFTLSLDGYNSYEIARKDGADYNGAFEYSDYLYRGKPNYPGDGNTYVDFVCKKKGQDTITVNGRVFNVNIQNNHLYQYQNGVRKLIDNGTTINACIGDKFTLSVNDGASHLLASKNPNGSGGEYVMEGGYLNRGAESYSKVNVSGTEISTTNVEFTCLKEGTTSFTANGKTITVNITPKYEIFVDTALGERPKDQVHEYLNLFEDWYRQHPEDFITVEVNGTTVPKYVKNNDGDTAGNWQYTFKPYRMSAGDKVELIAYVSPQDANLKFESKAMGTHTLTDLVTVVNHEDEILPDGRIRKTATVTTGNSYGSKKTGVALGNNYFYIIVDYDDVLMTHADIEIDDGGSYTFIKESIVDGKKVTEKYVYAAQVKTVNSCRIYGIDPQTNEYTPLKVKGITEVTYSANNQLGKEPGSSEKVEGSYYDQDVVFVENDYYNLNNNNQGSQYEWTSNYVDAAKYPVINYNIGYQENGKVYLRDATPETNKNFNLKDAQKAVFDVDLDLTLKSATRIVNGVSTNITDAKTTETISNMVFPLYRKDIIDAYNKCPFHTGLDFTLAANAVVVDFSIKKEYIGSDFEAGEFTFELFDQDGTPTGKTASNDENGNIKFQNLYFDRIGDYTFIIKEVKGNREDVIYDNMPKEITVHVTKDGVSLNADISDADLKQTFKNYRTYILPATGGTGVIPYTVTGIAMITAAAALLIRTRRKEEK
ncbi:MAG: LPXTG cell wall anchor domain-containing protein [Ruminococcus sp.]|nr:LPXTG cell wall anchor domain-containing protein [Ruminococcus sp.]